MSAAMGPTGGRSPMRARREGPGGPEREPPRGAPGRAMRVGCARRGDPTLPDEDWEGRARGTGCVGQRAQPAHPQRGAYLLTLPPPQAGSAVPPSPPGCRKHCPLTQSRRPDTPHTSPPSRDQTDPLEPGWGWRTVLRGTLWPLSPTTSFRLRPGHRTGSGFRSRVGGGGQRPGVHSTVRAGGGWGWGARAAPSLQQVSTGRNSSRRSRRASG